MILSALLLISIFSIVKCAETTGRMFSMRTEFDPLRPHIFTTTLKEISEPKRPFMLNFEHVAYSYTYDDQIQTFKVKDILSVLNASNFQESAEIHFLLNECEKTFLGYNGDASNAFKNLLIPAFIKFHRELIDLNITFQDFFYIAFYDYLKIVLEKGTDTVDEFCSFILAFHRVSLIGNPRKVLSTWIKAIPNFAFKYNSYYSLHLALDSFTHGGIEYFHIINFANFPDKKPLIPIIKGLLNSQLDEIGAFTFIHLIDCFSSLKAEFEREQDAYDAFRDALPTLRVLILKSIHYKNLNDFNRFISFYKKFPGVNFKEFKLIYSIFIEKNVTNLILYVRKNNFNLKKLSEYITCPIQILFHLYNSDYADLLKGLLQDVNETARYNFYINAIINEAPALLIRHAGEQIGHLFKFVLTKPDEYKSLRDKFRSIYNEDIIMAILERPNASSIDLLFFPYASPHFYDSWVNPDIPANWKLIDTNETFNVRHDHGALRLVKSNNEMYLHVSILQLAYILDNREAVIVLKNSPKITQEQIQLAESTLTIEPEIENGKCCIIS